MAQRLGFLFSVCVIVLVTTVTTCAQEDETFEPNFDRLDDQFDQGGDDRSIYPDIPQFGGPTSVAGQIAEDAAIVPEHRLQVLQDFFDPWFQFKERMNASHGL